MHITVKIEKDNRTFSFYWVSSPVIVIGSKTYGNKAPSLFEEFWKDENLIGKNVLLHHSTDDTYAYLSYM